MKLSIITINLNNAAGLRRTIESVVNQTLMGYEYIIIDGGSTDASTEVIKEFTDKITSWVSEPDNGIYNAMNKGILKAKNQYLLFLNSGDWLADSNVLEKVSSSLDKHDIIYGDLINYKEDLKTFAVVKSPKELTFDFFLSSSLPHPSSFIKRELFEKYGFYNEKLKIISDWEFFVVAIFKHNSSYKHLDFPVSVYNLNGISEDPQYHQILVQEINNSILVHFPGFLSDYEELHRLRKEINLMKKKMHFKFKHVFIQNRYTRYILNKLCR